MTFPTQNADENLVTADFPYIGNFHKTLPHNDYGEVDPDAYRKFKDTCLAIEHGSPINFEEVPRGPLVPAFAASADPKAIASGAKFTSPLSGASTETLGPDPKTLNMPPAPSIHSLSTAAEMIELYWMALLRDVPLLAFEPGCTPPPGTQPQCYQVDPADRTLVQDAVNELKTAFDVAYKNDADIDGGLRLGLDLPMKAHIENSCPCGTELDLRTATLFRCGLRDEEFGPLISQFFLRDIPYGVQIIDTKQTPYIMGKDFLTDHDDWLRAQNTGKDKFGRDYGTCNYYADQLAGRETYYPDVQRHISTIRDLARFVNRDALHQAYFNAALFLDAIGAPLDAGNPYRGNLYVREGGFATLGGPDLLTLVSEVASRALKVIWRQKWLVNRRARPEVYGGLMQIQFNGLRGNASNKRQYGLPNLAQGSTGASRVKVKYGTYYLPMAFSAGSPPHPAYGAGHATVAGACVTVLKAWYDEDAKLADVLAAAQIDTNNPAHPKSLRKDPFPLKGLLQPGARLNGEGFCEPQPYCGNDANKITVGGELNKVATNVAMGRSMGGVHWRSDNTRSLRVGEKIAIEILRKRTMEYAERPVSFTFRSFDQHRIQISRGQVMESET